MGGKGKGDVKMNDLFGTENYKITKPIRLIELFAGYGSQAMALKRIGANFEHWFVCEFDKYAVASYNAVHSTDFKPTDIKNVHAEDLRITDRDKYEYMLTYSFPCTDLSVAGKMLGMKKGDNTRSGLLWEVERILNECGQDLPQVLFMENVPQVVSERNKEDFLEWVKFLHKKGYSSELKILNAKDYGVPQNRERCFMFSFLGEFSYEFPKPFQLTRVMKDCLESNVDEKYYLHSEKANKLIEKLITDGVLESKKKSGNDNRQQTTDNRQQTTDNLRQSIYPSSVQGKLKSATVLQQGATGEFQTCGQREAVCLKNMCNKKQPFGKITEVACTLMARDYKGFSNYGCNGVVEW